jgi:hypothetical protein
MQAANAKFLQEKLERNLQAYGISVTSSAGILTAAGFDISFIAQDIASPMGGIDSSVSPFLGVGSAPSFIKLDVKAALASVALDADKVKVLSVVTRFANTVKIFNGSTELMVLEGHPDLKVVGL